MGKSEATKINSNTLEEPGPDGSENARYLHESEHFIKLLPKEIWDLISTYLNSKDFQNLINSSPFFRQLLLHKRKYVLFQPVMEILLPKYKQIIGYTDNLDPRPFITNNRLVCKKWKATIDKMASEWNDDKKDDHSVHYHLSKRYKLSEYKLDDFKDHFKDTHPSSVNPFPGKYLSFFFPDVPPKTFNILEKYGQHLSTCEIDLMGFGSENLPELHRNVIEWLYCMPNLQNLLIDYLIRRDLVHVPLVQLDFMPPNLKLLKNLIIKTGYPSSTNWLRVPDAIMRERIPDWSWLERYNLSNIIQAQENLESLKVVIFTKKDLEIMGRNTSPLKKVVAHCYCKENNMGLSEVLNTLSDKFSKSLEDVTLTFHVQHQVSGHINVMRDTFHERLNLPKVRKFEIDILTMCFLDFVLGMQDSLEELVIQCIGEKPGKPEYGDFSTVEKIEIDLMKSDQIVEFMGYQDNLLESNIWSLFPKLQMIDLSINYKLVKYSRKEWEQKVKLQS